MQFQRVAVVMSSFLLLFKTTQAISSGANEPIADNELGLTAKDCALQYCEELDALGLWLSLVDVCTHGL